MKSEEEANLTGTGETNEGSRGKQQGEVQEETCRATRPGRGGKNKTFTRKKDGIKSMMRLIFCLVQSRMVRKSKKFGRERKQNIRSPRRRLLFVLRASKAAEGRIVSGGIERWMVGKEIPIMLLSCHA